MLERWISETRDRQAKRPIAQDDYDSWLRMEVTQRLFEDLELAVIDSFQDYLPTSSSDESISIAMMRQGAAQAIETVLEWAPNGVRSKSDED